MGIQCIHRLSAHERLAALSTLYASKQYETLRLAYVTASDRGAEYCDERVCLFDVLCVCMSVREHITATKGKVFPYSLPSVGPGADPGVQAVSPQVT